MPNQKPNNARAAVLSGLLFMALGVGALNFPSPFSRLCGLFGTAAFLAFVYFAYQAIKGHA